MEKHDYYRALKVEGLGHEADQYLREWKIEDGVVKTEIVGDVVNAMRFASDVDAFKAKREIEQFDRIAHNGTVKSREECEVRVVQGCCADCADAKSQNGK
jgi:hypothetical protein